MLSRINKMREDKGFTLIELLVVIIIIGILAAVAIPVFLNQRTKGYDTSAKSDLKNLATLEETYLTDNNVYGSMASVDAAESVKVSKGVVLTVVWYDGANGYCLSAKHQSSANTYYYDSQAGGLLPGGSTGCSTASAGSAGGSKTG